MSEQMHNRPYQNLGLRLKHWRQQQNLSLAEVSGAVEIEPEALAKIELGKDCPPEEVLLLLMTHFNLEEAEADKLWNMAEYKDDDSESQAGNFMDEITAGKQPIVMLVQPENRVIYTDQVNITVKDNGLVANFLQDGIKNQKSVVSRVGMSRDQAESLAGQLQAALKMIDQPQKALPAPQKSASHNSTPQAKGKQWHKQNDQPKQG